MENDLRELIATSYTSSDAEAYCAFVPTASQLNDLIEIGYDVLSHVLCRAGACVMMSAVYAKRVQTMLQDAPVYVVAGALAVGTTYVFGQDVTQRDWKSEFDRSNPSWDGHCWLMFGGFIADISIFATAYSENSPRLLARYVRQRFGLGHRLLVLMDDLERDLRYKPQYVLTSDQITKLANGERFGPPDDSETRLVE
jgi:hypothetical protein